MEDKRYNWCYLLWQCV